MSECFGGYYKYTTFAAVVLQQIWELLQMWYLLCYSGPEHERQMLVGWQQNLNLPNNIPLRFVAMQHMAAEGKSDKWHLTQKCVWSKSVPLNSSTRKRWHALMLAECFWRWNSGYESIVRWWVVCSSSGSSRSSPLTVRFLRVQRAGSHSSLAKMHS